MNNSQRKAVGVCLVMSLVAMATKACTPVWDFNPSQLERLERAEIVLYGKEVTPLEECTGRDPGLCVRRQVQFHVYCVLKSSPAYTINDFITIGTRPDINSCDFTLFSHRDRQGMWIVLLRHDGQGLEWDELGMTSAKIAADGPSSPVWEDVQAACWFSSWKSPRNADIDRCPVLNRTQANRDDPTCTLRCPRDWYKVDTKCYRSGMEVSYVQAETLCQKESATLVADTGSSQPILSRLRPDSRYWISRNTNGGYRTIDKEGTVEAAAEADEYTSLCVMNARRLSPLVTMIQNSVPNQLNVLLSSAAFSQTFCCKILTAPGRTGAIKTTGGAYPALLFASMPRVELLSGDGDKYSMVFADVSGLDLDLGTETEPYIQWMVVNVPLDKEGFLEVAKGQTLIKYSKPLPEVNGQAYIIFVYKQSTQAVLTDLTLYSEYDDGRHFSLLTFQQANDLQLVAGTWFLISYDYYVLRHVVAKDRSREAALCTRAWPVLKQYVRRNTLHCPRGGPDPNGGAANSLSHILITLALVSALMIDTL